MAIDFPNGPINLADADPMTSLEEMHGGRGHAIGTNRILANLRSMATKLGFGTSAPTTAGVLRRTAAGQSAWDLVRAGDYAPGTIADANLIGSIAVSKLAHVGANQVLRSNGTQNVGGPIQAGDFAPGATSVKIKDIPITVNSTVADFTNIPQGFRSLRLEWQCLPLTGGNGVYVQLTADANPTSPAWDAGANYDYQSIYSAAGTVAAQGADGQGGAFVGYLYGGETSCGEIELPRYNDPVYAHAVIACWGQKAGAGSGQFYLQASNTQWRNAGPIRGVRVYFPGTVQPGSIVTLWGLA